MASAAIQMYAYFLVISECGKPGQSTMAVAAILSTAQWLVSLVRLQVAGSFTVMLSAGGMMAVGRLPETVAGVEAVCHSGTVSGASNMFLPFKL